jgi:hypothetical protein
MLQSQPTRRTGEVRPRLPVTPLELRQARDEKLRVVERDERSLEARAAQEPHRSRADLDEAAPLLVLIVSRDPAKLDAARVRFAHVLSGRPHARGCAAANGMPSCSAGLSEPMPGTPGGGLVDV